MEIEQIEGEIWKDIPGYNGDYRISNFGRVFSVPRKNQRQSKLIKPSLNEKGYLNISLRKNEKPKKFKLHRLVVLTFIGNSPDNKRVEINHKNCNKLDNRPENLEWVSHQENMSHASKNKLTTKLHSEDTPNAILTNKEVLEIRELHKIGQIGRAEIARKYKVSRSTIGMIITGKSWQKLK